MLTLYLLDKDKSHLIYSEKIKKVFALPADSPRSRGTVRQMLTDGVIVKFEDGTYQITEKGLRELALSFPLVRFSLFPWDGQYRIITYEIPEKKRALRDSLRREISGWGLGPWHRSFWLTPHPIIEALKELVSRNSDYQQYIQAFEGKPVVGDLKVLMQKVWNIDEVEKSYRAVFKQWHECLSDQGLSQEEKFRKIVNQYIELLKKDPGLPKELVGETWIGIEAWGIFKEMRRIFRVE